MKKSFFIALFLLLLQVVSAHDFMVDGIYYKINGDEAYVTYCGTSYNQYSNEYSGDVVIPETVTYNGKTYSVTSIEDRAFYNCTGVTSVIIGDSITTVGSYAFSECNQMKSLTIGNAVTTISDHAFYSCRGLIDLIIPNNVTSIRSLAFRYCSGLINLKISTSMTIIGDRVFEGCSSLSTVEIPNSVTTISFAAFRNCSSLSSVTIGNSVTQIDNEAFKNCTSLKSLTWNAYNCSSNVNMFTANLENVTIGQNVKVIPVSFVAGSKIEEINIPNSVYSIGKRAFSGCSELSSVSISSSVEIIGDSTFANCTKLASVNIPNSVTSIGKCAFRGCSNLASIVISNSVQEISNNLFTDCIALTNIIIPNSVKTISFSAFENCSELTRVTIPNSVITIGSSAFKECTKLEDITIPNSVISIGNAAFYQCYNLASVIIGDSVSTIGMEAFRYCYGLKSVTIGNSVSSIEYGAFYGCSELTRVNITDIAAWCNIQFATSFFSNPLQNAHHLYLDGVEVTDLVIPNTVTSIGDYAFYYCTGLTSVTIPNTVTAIGCDAFCGCDALTCVNITDIAAWCSIDFYQSYSNPLYFAHHLYMNGAEVTDLIIPGTVSSIGNYAFQYGNYITNLTIPNTVTSIGNQAFDHCYALKSVTIPNSVTTIGENAFNYCYLSSLMITGEGEWQAGAIDCSPNYLYIDSRITAVKGIRINPKTHVYSYAATPPICDENSFTNYSGTLHVPAASLAAYFIADYWSNFGNIIGDAVEPSIKVSSDSLEVYLGDQFTLTASVTPANSTPQSIIWRSTNPTVAIVDSNGTVTAVGVGCCDIIVECIYMRDTCHVVVKDSTISILLDQQEAMLLPNHVIILKPIPNPIIPDLVVGSSDTSVAAARVVDGKIQVVGIKEGSTTITVGSADGTAIPATCEVTVYTEPGDLDCDGYRNISDVTTLIDYLLSGNGSQISLKNADVDGDGKINISDVTTLIDILLRGV